MRTRFIMALGRTACWVLLVAICVAQSQEQQPASPSTGEDSLKRFLQQYVREDPLYVKKAIRYFDAFVDLNGDGKNEAIVYLYDSTGTYCGSGGCRMLILVSEASSYRVVTGTTITQPPIRVLSRSSHGWRNIAMWMRGGGNLEGYEVELQFDGKAYPSNPNMAPRLAGNVPGKVVIPNFKSYYDGKPLYPEASQK